MRTALSFVALVAAASAQTVHLVGPNTAHPQIRDAVAIANRNDHLVVLPGTYAHFELTVGLTIRAAASGTVRIEFDPNYVDPSCSQSIFCAMVQGSTELAVPASETVNLIGLEFVDNVALVGAFPVPHRVVFKNGQFVLDECVIRSRHDVALTAQDCFAHLQDTKVVNTGGGLLADAVSCIRANVLAAGCEFIGGQGALAGAARGLALSDSTVNASTMTLTGGRDSSALYTNTASEVWISDSTLTGATNHCAMEFNGTIGHYDRCTFNSATGPCYFMPQRHLLGVERVSGHYPGVITTTTFHTNPSALVGIVASFGLTPTPMAFVEQPWFADPATSAAVGVLVADTMGAATWSWTVPATAPSGLSVWLHGVSGTTLPLQSAPPVGGPIR